MANRFIRPNWPAPGNVNALTTTRIGGISPAPYSSLNLGDHVGDSTGNVAANRQRLITTANLPETPLWLRQTHSTKVITSQHWQADMEADAIISTQPKKVCTVMTADCLPVLLCDKQGQQVAAIHAGWRGLCAGIIEQTVTNLFGRSEDFLAWLGPAIGPAKFEVGTDVRDAFIAESMLSASAFQPTKPGHFLADIYMLSQQRLEACGVRNIYGADYCTFSQPELFFSYRRDDACGRMASLIWLTS